MIKNNELLILKWKCITTIIALLVIALGIYLFYPYQHSVELECSSGDINLDYKTYWVNEKVKTEIPTAPLCSVDQKIGVYYNCTNPNPIYVDSWNSKALPQYLRIMGIDNMNCKLKVSGTYNNIQVLELFYEFKDYLK